MGSLILFWMVDARGVLGAAIQALAGLMSVNGEPDERGGEPLRVGLPVVDMVTGLI